MSQSHEIKLKAKYSVWVAGPETQVKKDFIKEVRKTSETISCLEVEWGIQKNLVFP